nr:C-type lectin 3 [Bitis atropos]
MGRFIFLSSGLLVVFLSLSGTGAGEDCPSDWSSHEGHCYKVFKLFKNWDDAEKFCRKQLKAAHLVSIESKEEADFVAELVSRTLRKAKYDVWIGLRDDDKKQHCSSHWTDGSSVSYENVVGERVCYVLEKETGYRTWVALQCWNDHPFVCKSWIPH